MTEKPIPFTGPMVQALLAGVKTQTRRPLNGKAHKTITVGELEALTRRGFRSKHITADNSTLVWRPRVKPGDLLWVRELWRAPEIFDAETPLNIPQGVKITYTASVKKKGGPELGRLRSSWFMCRWMARIVLETTSSSAERLCDITEEDARADGNNRDLASDKEHEYRAGYRFLWDAIHTQHEGWLWADNPFVEVIKFQVVAINFGSHNNG